jgi:hypothetical protein
LLAALGTSSGLITVIARSKSMLLLLLYLHQGSHKFCTPISRLGCEKQIKVLAKP